MLREYSLVERRQEEEEQHLCEAIGQHLKRGIPAEIIADMLDKSSLFDEAGKNVFRDWVDVACLRADKPPRKKKRREKID